ncbi:MAG TPA: PfkB family carbohydrate kinase [Rhodothermales bacterium]|nr:PfkB family carbohydrate kinase [Rhodothermales bacterium]
MSLSLLAVGTVAFDSIETPFGSAERILGGSATYIALAARLLGVPVRLCAVVGRDFPDAHVDELASRGVDLEGLVRDPDGDTFFWAGRYHFDLNNRDTLATHLNVLATFKPVLPEAYLDSAIVCLGNLDPVIQSEVLDQVKGPDGKGPALVVCDTMNYWIGSAPEALAETLKRVDVLIVNDAEARELSGEPNLVRAARVIRAMGPQTLVIKKGEHGALLFCGDTARPTVFMAPAYPLEDIHDPTGAGDTFMGGFAGHLARIAEGDPAAASDPEAMKQAVVVGSALASFVVEAFGPDRLLEMDVSDLDERLSDFHRLSAIPAGLVAL